MAKNQHVVPHPKGWAVKLAGNERATRVTDTQRKALVIARRIARNQGVDVVIHDGDGKVRYDSYGNGPFPPPDFTL